MGLGIVGLVGGGLSSRFQVLLVKIKNVDM